MSSHVKTITMKSSTMFFGKIFDSLLMFVFNIFAARLLGAKDYGTYVYLSTIIMFGSIGLKMGLDQGIAAIVPKYDDDKIKKSIISFSLAFIVVMSLSLTLLSIVFSDFISVFILNNGSLSTYYVQMIPLLLFYALLQLSEGIFRTYGNIRDYVIAKNIIMPISILLVFLVGAFGFDIRTVQMLIISNYFGWILATLYILYTLIREQVIVLPSLKYVSIYKYLFALSIPLIFVGLLDYLVGRTDTFVVGYLIDEKSVGIYNVIDKVAYLSGYFFIAFSSILAPYITKLYHDKEIEKLEVLYKTITRLIVFINVGVMYLIILNANEILMIFGQEYTVGYTILIITVIAYTVNALGGPVVYMNTMTGAGRTELWIGSIMLILNVVLDWILVKRVGLIGVAITTLLVFFGGMVFRLYIMKKRLSILPFDRQYVFILLIASGLFVVVNWMPVHDYVDNDLVVIIVSSFIYTLLYCGAVFGIVLDDMGRKNMMKTIMQIFNR